MDAMRPLTLGLVVLVISACGGAESTEISETPETDRDPDVSAAAAADSAAPTVECLLTPESATAIADGLTVQGGGELRNVYAVQLASESDLGFLYVVAAEIDGAGMEGDGHIGTWAVGELGGGPIVAANTLAQEFSEWGAAAQEGSSADVARDAVANSAEAAAAEACAGGG